MQQVMRMGIFISLMLLSPIAQSGVLRAILDVEKVHYIFDSFLRTSHPRSYLPQKNLSDLPVLSKALTDMLEDPQTAGRFRQVIEGFPDSERKRRLSALFFQKEATFTEAEIVEILNDLIYLNKLGQQQALRKVKRAGRVDWKFAFEQTDLAKWRRGVRRKGSSPRMLDPQDRVVLAAFSVGLDLNREKARRILDYALGNIDYLPPIRPGILRAAPALSKALGELTKNSDIRLRLRSIAKELPESEKNKLLQSRLDAWPIHFKDEHAVKFLNDLVHLGDLRVKAKQKNPPLDSKGKRKYFSLKFQEQAIAFANILNNARQAEQELLIGRSVIYTWMPKERLREKKKLVKSELIASAASAAGLDLNQAKIRRVLDYALGATDTAPSFPEERLQPSFEFSKAVRKLVGNSKTLSSLRNIAKKNLESKQKYAFLFQSEEEIFASDLTCVDIVYDLKSLGDLRLKAKQKELGRRF